MNYKRRKRLPAEEYVDGILKGDRILLSKAITLVESTLPGDIELAETVLTQIIPRSGGSIRIGITGVPGVGKSTFIETFGKHITSQGKKLAVLTIDPSSHRSKGAILGDKTRMETLSVDPLAYIRPSASGSAAGGVALKTRECMFLCEAAGFEVIFIETVGVGQSETAVHDMVDFFLLLMLAGAGDELQGMKKGIMEMADSIVITKADGDNRKRAGRAMAEYKNALHLFPPSETGWYPVVSTCSALNNEGIAKIWKIIQDFISQMQVTDQILLKRKKQNISWMYQLIRQILTERFYEHPSITGRLEEMEKRVSSGRYPAIKAARDLITVYDSVKSVN